MKNIENRSKLDIILWYFLLQLLQLINTNRKSKKKNQINKILNKNEKQQRNIIVIYVGNPKHKVNFW